MGPIEAFTTAWRKSFAYGGSATRSEYWWFYLTNLIVVFVPILAITVATDSTGIGYIYMIAQIFPSLSIIVRRLRDIGKDWKWMFISLVPLIGGLWFLYLMCQPSGRYETN